MKLLRRDDPWDSQSQAGRKYYDDFDTRFWELLSKFEEFFLIKFISIL